MAETSKNKIYYNDNENSVADVLADMKKMAESTDEAIEKSKYNDAAIKKSISDVEKKQVEKNTEQDSKIVELQTEKAKLETELKEIQEDFYQNSIRGQASGEYIHVEDSSNCRAKIGIGGNSEQETRSGKNKYNGNDFTREGWAVSFTNLTNLVNSLAVGDYTISFDVEIASITKEDTRSYLSQISYTTEDVLPKKDYSLTFPAKNVGSKVHFSFQINITNETAGKYSFILYTMGNHSVGPCGGSTYKNIQVELGTQETSYEQYGAMPSTYYPSQVVAVGSNGSVKVTKCNKNIFDGKLETGEYDVLGNKISNSGRYRNVNKITIEENETYFFSIDGIGKNYVLFFYDKNGNFLTTGNTDNYKVKTPSHAKYMNFRCFVADYVADYSNLKIQIEKNTIETPFEQHKEQSYIMPVQKEMLQGDYFDFDNEEEVHTWNKYEATGNENWITASSDFSSEKIYSAYLSVSDMEKKSKIYSTHFKNIIDTTKQYIYVPYSNILVVGISKDIASDVTAFKNYLKAQYDAGTPVTIYYKLATPERLKFTDEQKAVAIKLNNARTYKNVTNITTDSKAILSLDYAKDLETLLNNTQALAVNNASEGV